MMRAWTAVVALLICAALSVAAHAQGDGTGAGTGGGDRTVGAMPRKCNPAVTVTVDDRVLHHATPAALVGELLADQVETVPDKADARVQRGIDIIRLAAGHPGVDRVHVESCWGRESRTWSLAELAERGSRLYLVPTRRGAMRAVLSRPGANPAIATRGVRGIQLLTPLTDPDPRALN